MIVMAIVAAVLGAVLGFMGAGFGAASLLVSTFGNREGAAAMNGFFVFGPIGGLAGALLGVGLVLRFGGGSPSWGKGLMISAAVLTCLGGLLLAMTNTSDRSPSYSYVIEFQLEVPATALTAVDIPSTKAMWGAAGGDASDKPISQFFDKTCDGAVCVLNGSVAALGAMDNFHITAEIGPKKYRCPLELPAVVKSAADWSEWRPCDDARFRWRVVKR